MDVFSRIGGRKLLMSVLVMIVGGVVTGIKGDIPANFLNLLQVILGAFVTGNVAAGIAGVVVGGKQVPTTNNLDQVYNALATVFGKVEEIEKTITASAQVAEEQGKATVIIQRAINKLLEKANEK